MLAKIVAFGLLALAVSPFTAPFQTCDTSDVGTPFKAAALVAPVLLDESDPGSLVAPARLKFMPSFGLTVSYFLAARPVTFLAHSVARTRIADYLGLPTVLRR